jgi:hypothetical protein
VLGKTQALLKKPAGRLNAGIFTGFSAGLETGLTRGVFQKKKAAGILKMLDFSLKMSNFGGQYK